MIVFESRKARRVLVRLERGEELLASLAALAKEEKIRSAWIRGVGALEWVELDRHDQARRAPEPPQRFDTPCDVLTLEGHVATEDGEPTPVLFATLSRRTDNGVDVLGGRVVRAGVFAVELALEVFGDVRLERTADARTGLSLWAGPSRQGVKAKKTAEPSRTWTRPPAAEAPEAPENDEEPAAEAAPSAPASSGGVTWADVAAVSAAPEVAREEAPPPRSAARPGRTGRRAKTPDFEPPPLPDEGADFTDEPTPEKGDFIQHRQFGLCRVDRHDGQGGVTIKLPSGVRKKIKLDYMEVGQPRMEGKKRVYPVRPRRR
jgi:hypothetical protein